MPFFEAGTTFIDFKATSIQGQKPKYFIGMNNAEDEDDIIIAFVFDTQHELGSLKVGCNKEKLKFILKPNELSFITELTAIQLATARYYTLKVLCSSKEIKILGKSSDVLARQIKNCIDMNYIVTKYHHLIKGSFK